MERSWKHISEISDISLVNTVICDTRDFHCNCFSDDKFHDIKNAPGESLIPASEVLKWIAEVEEIAGGRGQWRCLVFENVECKGWLKYIRMYKHPTKCDYFVVCNGYDTPINWKNCNSDNLNKESLWLEKISTEET